ncbi:MAG: hypothetical protein NTZ78_01155 [Candidatus Aureabacteria bacterium]|nr:hypothetical protein [Candidatus Auribacterota bacterium]
MAGWLIFIITIMIVMMGSFGYADLDDIKSSSESARERAESARDRSESIRERSYDNRERMDRNRDEMDESKYKFDASKDKIRALKRKKGDYEAVLQQLREKREEEKIEPSK